MRDRARRRGFTLIELMISIAVMAILMALAVQAFVVMARSQRPRELVAQMQGEGRTGITLVETDLREASLGAGTGVIWAQKGVNRVRRPAVQIYDNVAALTDPSGLRPKRGTDALLIVRAAVDGRAALVGDVVATDAALPVTDPANFTAGSAVLLGEYEDAAWIPIQAVDAGTRTLTPSATIALYPSENATVAASGSAVRRARALLYYVNTRDQLIRAELAVPYMPASRTQVLSVSDVAQGVENLQVTCSVEAAGAGLAACPAPVNTGDVATEAVAMLGTFGAGGGARLNFQNVPSLRTVTASLVVRSRPLAPDSGVADPAIALEGVTLNPSVSTGARYLRRAFRIGIAVRNTSLGSF